MDKKVWQTNESWVKSLGRTLFLKDTLWCALSGSGIEFKVRGKYVQVLLAGDDKTHVSKKDLTGQTPGAGATDMEYARVAIYVNEKRIVDECLSVPEKAYAVLQSEQVQEVTVRVVKLSEAPMSLMGIRGIEADADAEFLPVAERALKIEFIGDSITCGYGVDAANEEEHFSTATEDVTSGYAYLTAQMLHADYSMVSYSGHGIISGYTETDEKLLSELVPPFYPMAGYSRGLVGGCAVTEEHWDFARFSPDVVIINLGTNDDSYCKDIVERQEEFATEYAVFLEQVRENNPKAYILCAYGIMSDRLYVYIKKAVEMYRKKTKDERVGTCLLSTHVAEDGYGADWHPSKVSHRKAATELTNYVQDVLRHS